MVEFQLVSVTLEDRYPPGFDKETLKNEFLASDFCDAVQSVKVEKKVVGTVAFLFGRTENGQSVCVRMEGVRPKLYFSSCGANAAMLRTELERELYHGALGEDETIHINLHTMCHFNGYEPDEGTQSKRKEHVYFEACYPSIRSYRAAVKLRRDNKRVRPCHEDNVDVLTRFLRESKIVPGGWMKTVGEEECHVRVSTCDVEVGAAAVEQVDRMDMSPYSILYYDLETLGLDPSVHQIIQWSLVYVKGSILEKHCVMIGNSTPLDGCVLHSVLTEEQLLSKGRQLIVDLDPDFMVAYNGVNFDNRFLAVRAETYQAQDGPVHPLFYISRFGLKPSRFRELSLSSSGMGDNKYNVFDMPGRAFVDFFVKFKVDEPSEISYSLSHFTRKYVPGEDKEPMDYKEIPVLQNGSDADRNRLASYCIHDSYLLERLNQTRNVIINILQFASVFGVLPEWVYLRGQQVRFVSQVLEAARTYESTPLILNRPPNGFVGANDDSGFTGATVNDPISDFYREEPVGTLDWKSLYPSEMIGFNLCHSTHILDPEYNDLPGVRAHCVRKLGTKWQVMSLDPDATYDGCNAKVDALLKQKYREMTLKTGALGETKSRVDEILLTSEEWNAVAPDGTREHEDGELDPEIRVPLTGALVAVPVGAHTTRFVTTHKGILPRILENLLAERSRCKKMMKKHAKRAKELAEMDPEQAAKERSMADVYDGRQLAVKISCNSVYGACGAGRTGSMPNKDVSETVTHEGRRTMDKLKDMLIKRYPNMVVVYGDTDSVMVKLTGVTSLEESAKVFQEAADWVTDEFSKMGLPSMVLEYEKSFHPYLLIRKKRYIGKKYEPNDAGGLDYKGIDAKGVETERKDTLPYLKETYIAVRDVLMHERDEFAALKVMEDALWKMVRGEVPFEKFIMQKGLKSTYKDETTQVQWCVNEKKRLREPGSEAQAGERVEYVILNGKSTKATDLAEDPAFAKRHNLKLNIEWYLHHAFRNPMQALFGVIPTIDIKAVFDKFGAEMKRVQSGASSMSEFAGSSSGKPLPKVHVPRPIVAPKRKPKKK